MTSKRVSVFLLLASLIAPALAARAQTANLVDRLPADTVFYFYSRGAAAIPSADPNALVSLWNDPGFAPMRQWIAEGFTEAISRNPKLSRIPPAEWELLLRHPFVFGVRLVPGHGPASARDKEEGPRSVLHGFLVLAAAGRAAEDARDALLASQPKKPIHVRLLTSGFLIAAEDRSTLDSLAAHFAAAAPSGSPSLTDVPAYQEARRELAGSPFAEWFLRVPDVAALQPQATANFNTPAFLHALQLQRVHLLCGSLDLGSPAARFQFSILGDTAPGSLFDLFGSNTASFSTLAAAPADSSINISRLDIGAAVTLAVNALSSAMPAQQAARIKMLVGLFSPAVLPALGGEYASIRPHPVSDHPAPAMYVLTIHHQAAQQLFQSTLAPFVHPAGTEGDIEYFRTTPHKSAAPSDAKTGQDQTSKRGSHEPAGTGSPSGTEGGQKAADGAASVGAGPNAPTSATTYFFALTPQFLIAGRDEQLVRRTARVLTAARPSPGLAADPYFRKVRAELPGELSGLGYIDLRQAPWRLWLERTAAQLRKDKKDPHAAERAAALEDWARRGGGAVLARHLHVLFIGSWKNSTGVRWTGQLH